MAGPQRFSLDVGGHHHEVEIVPRGVRRRVVWRYDGEPVATVTSRSDPLRLGADEGVPPDAGTMELRFTGLGRAKRATWRAPGQEKPSRFSHDGLDLDPEPGSPAAALADRVALHPGRYTLLQTGVGVVRVVAPILISLLAIRFAISLPWPSINWPTVPLPHLPSIPWPSINWPSIPWPDWDLPGWLVWALEHIHFVWPVVLAFVLARAEIRRRRTQEERKAALRDGQAS